MMRHTSCAAGVLACSIARIVAAQTPLSPTTVPLPSDAGIRKILAERVDSLGGGVGMVVGVVERRGRRVVSYGHPGPGDRRPLDGDTAFEIGSVTKVFTALLLADMVRQGEVALADPVSRYLPAGVRVPERNGRPITLVDLATHTSGLPFMPDELGDLSNFAAADYPAARLEQFLARQELSRDVGAAWEYSNIGYWLLGRALASRAGMDFETLLEARVTAPLGLRGTALTLPPGLEAKLTVGHDASLQRAPSISAVPFFTLMPAAGGLVSTPNDLLTLLAVALGFERSPLALAMADTLSTRRPTGQAGLEQALGWMVIEGPDGELIVHDGGTLGYASALAWDPRARVGVVVLSNQVASVTDVARHLLRPDVPLVKPTATRHTEITLDPVVLDAYAGRYEARGEGVFAVVRERDFLTIQPPASWGLPKLRLRPEGRCDFFVAELPLRVTFQTGADGRVSGLLVHPPRGQEPVSAERASSDR